MPLIYPETMKHHINLKFESRYHKNRRPLIAEIFKYEKDNHTLNNPLFGRFYTFLADHNSPEFGTRLFYDIKKDFRFQLLFFNEMTHWTACDVFVEKMGDTISNVNIFLLDAALHPAELFDILPDIFGSGFPNAQKFTYYAIISVRSIQMDSENCGYFALDHISQLSLLDPVTLYRQTLPGLMTPEQKKSSERIAPWNILDTYTLPLPLLRNMQAGSNIETLRQRREAELNDCNSPMFRHQRPWSSQAGTFLDYIHLEEISRSRRGKELKIHFGNTAIDYKREKYTASLTRPYLNQTGRNLTFEEKIRMVYWNGDNMGIQRQATAPHTGVQPYIWNV